MKAFCGGGGAGVAKNVFEPALLQVSLHLSVPG